MSTAPEEALKHLFTDARSHFAWLPDRPVDDALLRRLYEVVRMGPTGANAQPLRVVFVKSAEAKERLRPTLAPLNVDKTMTAPVTAIIAYDAAFHEHMHVLFPARPEMKTRLAGMAPEAREKLALLSSTLQAGYLIIAARGLGLDCGPMGGFDAAKVDAAFLEGTSWKTTLLVNLGYGDPTPLHPRLSRLDFDVACRIV